MFKLNLKIAFRNLWKYKGYALINVAGLSIGLTGCLLIFIFLRYQLSFDRGYRNQDRIYRIVSSWNYPDGEFYSQGVPRPLAAAARVDFPDLEKVASIIMGDGIIRIRAAGGKAEIKEQARVFFTEAQFFDIIQKKWLAGAPH